MAIALRQVAFSLRSRLTLEALETLLRIPANRIVESALEAYVAGLPEADKRLLESLVSRASEHEAALESSTKTRGSEVHEGQTVKGKSFNYRGSLDEGLVILFENSQPLKIPPESIAKIRTEIRERRGPALMGAIFAPLLPGSIGEAVARKHGISPINLSYVVPLLVNSGEVHAFKKGRYWMVSPAAKR